MVKKTVQPQKKRGPPATGKGEPIQVRLQPDALARLDDWIARDGGMKSRPAAIRAIMDAAMPAKTVAPEPRRRAR